MPVLVGLLTMLVFGAFLSFFWSLLSAAIGLPVASPNSSSAIISIAAVFAASASVARREGRWWLGPLTGLAVVFLSWGQWIFVSSRFRLPEAITLGLFGGGLQQIMWWVAVVFISAFAGLVGMGFSVHPRRHGFSRPSSAPLVIGSWFAGLLLCAGLTVIQNHVKSDTWVFHSTDNPPVALSAYFRQIRLQTSSDTVGAKHMRAVSDFDGTQYVWKEEKIAPGSRSGCTTMTSTTAVRATISITLIRG